MSKLNTNKKTIIELPKSKISIKELTKDMLPRALSDYLFEISENTKLPKEYLVGSALGYLAGLLGNRARVEVNSKYKVTPVLWACLIGASGSGKSPCMELAYEPLKEISKVNNEQFLQLQQEFKVQQKTQEIKMTKLKREYNSKNNNSDESKNEVLKQIESLEREKILCPFSRNFMLSSGSIEGIYETLEKESPSGMLMMIDELSGLFAKLNKYDNQEVKAIYLSLYNGYTNINNKTVSRGNDIVENGALSIVGGIQLAKMKEVITKDDSSGLLARFQLPILVHTKAKKTLPEDNIIYNSYKDYEQCFHKINSLPHCFNIENNKLLVTDPLIYKYSDKAYDKFRVWFDNNQDYICVESNDYIAEFLSKAANTVCTLALIFHLINNQYNDKEIGVEEVTQAIKLTEFFIDNARCLYYEELSAPMKIARDILDESLDFLKKEQETNGYLAQRNFRRLNRSSLKDDDTLQEVIDILEEYNYLINLNKKTKKYKHYILNPEL
ncbi:MULTISPECIES: DUF3987 domain-containing protein [unclassified Francisella]|uniref:DUF3987 domain-containing protein n=1 Tax=unclassified Francisella TaxID=2610885 RepID=UPI002E373A4D|nr:MULTISPECIES: DUF3987 domain-containing protein [unclassified Francisella]MED7818507.1 DUF3987 domain-containing protein [Francisella sp. 19S2-4]MED7829343.1 DUF3987 domain-containing protein [Francisella sp. 19S2-10]